MPTPAKPIKARRVFEPREKIFHPLTTHRRASAINYIRNTINRREETLLQIEKERNLRKEAEESAAKKRLADAKKRLENAEKEVPNRIAEIEKNLEFNTQCSAVLNQLLVDRQDHPLNGIIALKKLDEILVKEENIHTTEFRAAEDVLWAISLAASESDLMRLSEPGELNSKRTLFCIKHRLWLIQERKLYRQENDEVKTSIMRGLEYRAKEREKLVEQKLQLEEELKEARTVAEREETVEIPDFNRGFDLRREKTIAARQRRMRIAREIARGREGELRDFIASKIPVPVKRVAGTIEDRIARVIQKPAKKILEGLIEIKWRGRRFREIRKRLNEKLGDRSLPYPEDLFHIGGVQKFGKMFLTGFKDRTIAEDNEKNRIMIGIVPGRDENCAGIGISLVSPKGEKTTLVQADLGFDRDYFSNGVWVESLEYITMADKINALQRLKGNGWAVILYDEIEKQARACGFKKIVFSNNIFRAEDSEYANQLLKNIAAVRRLGKDDRGRVIKKID